MTTMERLPTPFMSDEDVYFVLAPDAGKVKIGVTNDIGRRLREIQLASPVPVRLGCIVPGAGRGGEIQLHDVFSHLRSHGEWFDLTEEIRATITHGYIKQITHMAEWLNNLDAEELKAFLDKAPKTIEWAEGAIEFLTRALAAHEDQALTA